MKFSRRKFVRALTALPFAAGACRSIPQQTFAEPIIDIHQHTHYHGRLDRDLVHHQRAMGATTTVLLPAGRYYGLAAECGGNDTVVRLASRHTALCQ
jgi:hypothetical protein